VNVLFCCDYFKPFEIGGAERSADLLARALTDRGIHVTVVTPNYGAAPQELSLGVDIRRLPFPQKLRRGESPRRFWLANPALQAAYAFRMARLAAQAGAEVLHVQNSALVAAGTLAARIARRPVVVTVRDMAYVEPRETESRQLAAPHRSLRWALDSRWATIERQLKRRALAASDAILFVSEGLRQEYARRGLAALADRGRVGYNIAPDLDAAPFDCRDTDTVLFAGKLSTGKGLHLLYAAAEIVLASRPSTHFVLAGARGVGFAPPAGKLGRAFELLGALEPGAVHNLMRTAAVLVAPSVWPEPFSRVLLEAMMLGTPIVATRAGGNEEVVDDDCAVLVEAGDASALSRGLLLMLEARPRARSSAAAARRRAIERFSASSIVPRILEIYAGAGVC
jgi:glycosyltransferase involved in cell wall biosynthesis